MLAFAVSVLATEAAPGGGGGFGTLPILLVMGVIFWLLLIRPQQKRSREQRALLSSLGPGDRVVTIGGIHGTIVELDDEIVRVEVTPGTVLTFARQAIGRRLVDADASEEMGVTDDGVDDAGSATADTPRPSQP